MMTLKVIRSLYSLNTNMYNKIILKMKTGFCSPCFITNDKRFTCLLSVFYLNCIVLILQNKTLIALDRPTIRAHIIYTETRVHLFSERYKSYTVSGQTQQTMKVGYGQLYTTFCDNVFNDLLFD